VYDQPTEDDISQMPWKYVGYRQYSEFLSSDEDLLIVRRFGVLNARVLLSLQDRVSELEDELEDFDDKHSRKGPEEYNNGSFRMDFEDRKEILGEIATALSQYSKTLFEQRLTRMTD
jgi:hypothetical protein